MTHAGMYHHGIESTKEEFQDPKIGGIVPYKGIFWWLIPLHSPAGLIYM